MKNVKFILFCLCIGCVISEEEIRVSSMLKSSLVFPILIYVLLAFRIHEIVNDFILQVFVGFGTVWKGNKVKIVLRCGSEHGYLGSRIDAIILNMLEINYSQLIQYELLEKLVT